MKYTVLALVGALSLGGCVLFQGDSPESKIVDAERVYNIAMSELNANRRPCVATDEHPEYGPENPLCLINDALYHKIESVRVTANGCIEDAKRQLNVNPESPNVDTYLACASGSAAALLEYVVRE